MGCSVGLIAVRLPRAGRLHGDNHAQLLRRQRARHAPAQLLFRVGGVAALLSTSPVNARFRLKHVVRTFTGASDDGAYRCVFQEEDDQGNVGINLNKKLMAVAGSSIKHLCIHAGGRAVIDQLQKKLGLSDEQVEASRMTLHRFGNTSSISLWYELAYVEAKGRMCNGDRVWMIGFGSGFKCNSVVWECIQPAACDTDGPWTSSITRYPVDIPDVLK
ncbi:hypothetical protein ZWY2020_003065 [Hordeum vulgare]|nr:hypothetical protein ZWY2020_003065 [Hordeum vulgare]